MSGETELVFEKVDGFTESGIHYRVMRSAHSKDPLVLIYGYGGNMGMWPIKFVERLAEKFVVVYLDNRGVGESICPMDPRQYSTAIMADDVDAVVNALDLREFHLLGYSLGGCIALTYAHKHQSKLKSLFLMSTTGGGEMWAPPPSDPAAVMAAPQGETLWDEYVSVWKTTMGDEMIQKYEPELRELFEASKDYITPNEALGGHLRAFRKFDSSEWIEQIAVPTTILVGEKDRLVPAQNAENLSAKMKHAKLVRIPDCEHYPQMEKQPLLLHEIFARCQSAQ